MRVLFVGNSYTYVNELPRMVRDAANSIGFEIEVTSNVKGGGILSERLNKENDMFLKLDEVYSSESFDVVVLQEQSFLPAKDKAEFLRSVLGLRKYFSKGEEFVFYQTWAYKDGTPKLQATGISYDEMWERLRDAYGEAADISDGIVCPVGDAFAYARKYFPELELYDPDGSHLIPIGTYLAACMFCSVLTGVSPLSIGTPDGINEAEAKTVREIADIVLR